MRLKSKVCAFAATAMMALSPQLNATTMKKRPYLIYPDVNTEMTVMWQAKDQVTSCYIEWGTTTAYGNNSGQLKTIGWQQFKFKITGLTPGTRYYYRVTVDDEKRTGSFMSAPDDDADQVSFYAMGDTRNGLQENRFENIASAMLADVNQAPDERDTFWLLPGDWTDNWDKEYFNHTQPSVLELFSRIPVMGCDGNHDGSSLQQFYPYEQGMNHTFEYGPVFVISCLPAKPGTPHYKWVEQQLASTTKPFKIVQMHHPGWGGYAKKNNGTTRSMQPLFEKWGVAMVLTGHAHIYSRSQVGGVAHVIAGGGGAPLVPASTSSAEVVTAESVHNFIRFDVDGDLLTATAYRYGVAPSASRSGAPMVRSGQSSIIETFQLQAPVMPEEPSAQADSYTTDADTVLNVDKDNGVLSNDTDFQADPLAAVLEDDVDHGALTLNNDGSFQYTPNAGYNGFDEFTYHAFDGTNKSQTVKVKLTVGTPPASRKMIIEGDKWKYSVGSVDSETTWYNLNYDDSAWNEGPSGFGYGDDDDNTVIPTSAKSVFIRKNFNIVNVNELFGMKLYVDYDDGYAAYVNGTLVASANAPSPITNKSFATGSHEAGTPVMVDILAAARPVLVDGSNVIAIVGLNKVAKGDMSLAPELELTANSFGDNAPVALNDTATLIKADDITVQAPGVLGNDSDVDRDPLTAVLVSSTTNGQLILDANGGYEYTPTPTFVGVDTFTYYATDGKNNSNNATVTITVKAPNNAPVASDISGSVAEDAAIGTTVLTVPATDADTGDTLSYAITAGNTGNAFAVDANGKVTVASALDFETLDSYTLTVTVSDNGLPVLKDTATVVVTVTDVVEPNHAPVLGALGGPGVQASFTTAGAVAGASSQYVATSNGITMTMTAESVHTDPDKIWFASPVIGVEGSVNKSVDPGETLVMTFDQDVLIRSFTTGNHGSSETLTLTSAAFDGLSGVTGAVYDDVTDSIKKTGSDISALDDSRSVTGILLPLGETLKFSTGSDKISYKGIVVGTSRSPIVVPDDTAISTVIETAKATDTDSADKLTYAITAGNSDGKFTIDPDNGEISVAGALDYNTTAAYTLTVTVSDDGTPVKTDSADLKIAIKEASSPALGVFVTQTGSVVSWSIGQELDVKEYRLVNVETGAVEAVILANGSHNYSYSELKENVKVKLVVVDYSGYTQSFTAEDGAKAVHTYNLVKGWNLIATVGDAADLAELQRVSGSAMWGWDGRNYVPTDAQEAFTGLWVYLNREAVVTVTAKTSESSLTLEPGWSLAGPGNNVNRPDAVTAFSWSDSYKEILENHNALIKGQGYWLFVENSITIEMK